MLIENLQDINKVNDEIDKDTYKPSVVNEEEILNWDVFIPLPKVEVYEIELEFIYMGRVKPLVVEIDDI